MPTIFSTVMHLNKSLFLVVLALVLAHLAQYWPLYFKGQLPFPGDMLVAFHFPWSGGGFAGFDRWTTYKALNTVDTIKQFYPWKVFAIEQLHQGIWPLWNPYSFSGMPFIANLQSGIFFPLNLVYIILPVLWGWIANVTGQLLLFGFFSYLFLRSEKLSRLAAVFGAVVAMNLSYLSLWQWQLVITQSALFLPLILYFINRRQLLIIPLLLSFCFLGGHAQTTVYVYLVFIFFALFRHVPVKKIILICIFPIFLAAVQILPSAQTYMLSAREGTATKDLFAPFIFHWQNIVTTIAPDFFGHPSTRNYTGTDYRDMNAYFGLTAFMFSLVSLGLFKNKNIRFFILLAIFGLLFATYPLVFIFNIFNIPILSSGVPARMIFIFQFAAGVLAAYGFEHWINFKSRPRFVVLFVGIILGALWLIGGPISKSNLILPTILYGVTSALIFLRHKLAILGIFGLLFFQYSFFFQKYNSFSPQKFVFPQHPILSFLQKNAGVNRFYGTEQAIFNYNFSVYYKLFDFEGYDSMYPRRYGQLVASVETASIPNSIPRSDAYIKHWSDRKDERLLDLLGVKYLMDKNDLLTGEWDEEPSKFNPERYQLIWQHRPWRIYERKTVLPRAFLANGDEIITDDSQIIKRLYDVNFDYQHKLILETDPHVPESLSSGSAQIVLYKPNKIIIQTSSPKQKLLFLSDNYYPGWQATVDDKPSKIFRANFTFRAVVISAGSHEVVFQYDPPAFKIGGIISLISVGSYIIFLIYKRRNSPNSL